MSFILLLALVLPLFASSALSDCCYSLDPTWLETSKYILNITVVNRVIALSSASEYVATVAFPSGYTVTNAQSACSPVASSSTPTYLCSGKGRKSLFVRFALDTTVNGLTNENPSATVTVGNEQCSHQAFCNEPIDPGASTVVDDSVVNLGFGVYPKPAVIVAGCVGGLFFLGLCYLWLRQRRRTGEGPDRNHLPGAENQTGLMRTIQARQNAAVDGKIEVSVANDRGGGLVGRKSKTDGEEKRKKVRDKEKNPSSDAEQGQPGGGEEKRKKTRDKEQVTSSDAEPVHSSQPSGGASLTRVRSRGRRTPAVEPVGAETTTTPSSTPLSVTELSGSKARPTGSSVAPTGGSINDSKKKPERADGETSPRSPTTKEPVPASPTLDQLVVERTPRFDPVASPLSTKDPARPSRQTFVREPAAVTPLQTTFHAPVIPSGNDEDDVPLSILADQKNDDENLPLANLDERKPHPLRAGEESDEDLPLIALVDHPVVPQNHMDRPELGGDDPDDQVPLSTLATSAHPGS